MNSNDENTNPSDSPYASPEPSPFEPPSSSPFDSPADRSGDYSTSTRPFEDLTGLTRTIKTLLVIEIVVVLGSLLFVWIIQRGIDQGELPPKGTAELFDFIGAGELILSIIRLVCVLVWVYRANHNVRALGARKLAYSPGWAVGWHFIPVASIFMPCFAISEISRASRSPEDWRGLEPSGAVRLWATLWILLSLFTLVQFALAISSPTNEVPAEFRPAEIAATLLGTVLHAAFFVVVSQVLKSQLAHIDRVDSTIEGEPDEALPRDEALLD